MEAKLKQRIVGMAVLLIAALIVVALLLYHSTSTQQTTLNVPVAQDTSTVAQAPSSIGASTQVAENTSTSTQTPAIENTSTSASPSSQSETSENASISAASTSQEENASTVTPTQTPIAGNTSTPTPTVASPEISSTNTSITSTSITAQTPAAENTSIAEDDANTITVPEAKTYPKAKSVHHLSVAKEEKKPRAKLKSLVAKAWSIQLGSFENKKNANHLVLALRKKGFAAYSKPFKTQNGWMIRIFVGPEIHKNDAEKLVVKLHQLFHMKGIVVEYRV